MPEKKKRINKPGALTSSKRKNQSLRKTRAKKAGIKTILIKEENNE